MESAEHSMPVFLCRKLQAGCIKSALLSGFVLLGGCFDVSSRIEVEEQYYASGSRMCAVEMRRDSSITGRQTWKPHGQTVFWNRDGTVLKKENYVDGSLCGPYVEFFPSGKPRVVADLDMGGIRKRWKEFDENGTCIIDKSIVGWDSAGGASGCSDIQGKMVAFSELRQDSESTLFFKKSSGLLYSGMAMVEKSDDGTIIKSYDFLGGKKVGEFVSERLPKSRRRVRR
jgi:hypothetical protein